jgi:hypothetical protein
VRVKAKAPQRLLLPSRARVCALIAREQNKTLYERLRPTFIIIIYYLKPFVCIVKSRSVMLCLHYYSNYVTLRIAEDDGDEYSLDQIKEFDVENENQSWSDVLARFGPTGRLSYLDFLA